ncbi:MAG TPA: hypothetical protein DCE41_09760 [Cytophagales bacterium]|nr:hypothetical protein [Cytophagales bacterium]HAA22866.1 hypothetical protein [Cytophagales bacterium]HAP62350.1 hypothetical protein [Cytophagales bacterium]
MHASLAEYYKEIGGVEKALMREAVLTTLNADLASEQSLFNVQQLDPTFISNRAIENRFLEDVAESFLPYVAVEGHVGRISQGLRDTLNVAIPNRMEYFRNLEISLYPLGD